MSDDTQGYIQKSSVEEILEKEDIGNLFVEEFEIIKIW